MTAWLKGRYETLRIMIFERDLYRSLRSDITDDDLIEAGQWWPLYEED